MQPAWTPLFYVVNVDTNNEDEIEEVAVFFNANDAESFAKENGYQVERIEFCHHGMSAWLCDDPVSHYPRGYPFD